MSSDAVVRFHRGKAEVVVNGVDIANAVLGLSIRIDGGKPAQVEADLFLQSFEVDGQLQLKLGEPERAALIALGWTAPAEEA